MYSTYCFSNSSLFCTRYEKNVYTHSSKTLEIFSICSEALMFAVDYELKDLYIFQYNY